MSDQLHTFHLPVMGTGFTIDAPVKVAKYGVSSVLSLVDDTLIEEMRKFYCEKSGEAYTVISKFDTDHRARRITEYLNLLDRIVKKQFAELKSSAFEIGSEITKYFELLPDTAPLKILYNKMLKTSDPAVKKEIQEELRESIRPGSIDVNIMTKLDRQYYDKDGNLLPDEFSDALAALRGYAKSTLQSAIVFSAGFHQKLYGYAAEFKDFYADAKGFIKKRIILKVSDYRSSLIQGKVFAKKGLWVSEYRIESGLNCGGHTFVSNNNGYFMGPILKEFREKRQELISGIHKIYNKALELKNKMPFAQPHEVKVTAQGGICTPQEDEFLRSHYGVDATGWGTPFLLCPEASNVEDEIIEKLSSATKDDLYISDVSPVFVPFSNLRGSTCDLKKEENIKEGNPGSACPKGHLTFNTEFTEKPICVASRQYQKFKLDQLKEMNLPEDEYQERINAITVKACICHQLGNGVRMKYDLVHGSNLPSATCPGPDMEYFSKVVTFKEMVDHIYGRISLLKPGHHTHVFLNELRINIDYFIKDVKKGVPKFNENSIKNFNRFLKSALKGIEYYKELFSKAVTGTQEYRSKCLEELHGLKKHLEDFVEKHRKILSKEE